MRENVTHKLISSHLVDGTLAAGARIGIAIDQTLTQDATGTLVMLELEAMGLHRVKTELSVQYVDHNLLQTDFRNADDHVFLRSACECYGIWYSPAGNGVSHPLHMGHFGRPGASLLGADSHTCAAGSLGMLAIGAGGLEVAMAMAGEPFDMKMPEVMGVKLTGKLPDWVSAKDVILEMLRRHHVDGGVGKVIEYYGPGLAGLSAMDRHVIANMGAELGATTTVFPSDEQVRRFLRTQGREHDWKPLVADQHATYDHHDEIDLSRLEPLIACPSSPDNVVPVKQVAGKAVFQTYIGSSANPGFRDFAIAAAAVGGQHTHPGVSFDINPTSRQVLNQLATEGWLGELIRAGARIHQTGCNGCIGMGQAPATGRISLRTVPRNFPGRSGTQEDAIYLCSPETAVASALKGKITDPRTLRQGYPSIDEPTHADGINELLVRPTEDLKQVELEKGPNIKPLPRFTPLSDGLQCPVLLKVGDDVSTDEIMPAGAEVLPYRSNIPEISKFVFARVDSGFYERAVQHRDSGSFVVAGKNYGQGSSREHAALAPRSLGVKAVLAKSFARIHRDNLCNFGILPLTFASADDYGKIRLGDELHISGLHSLGSADSVITVENRTRRECYAMRHGLSPRQIDSLLAGSLLTLMRVRDAARRLQTGEPR